MAKRVYLFNEGSKDDRELLGGKGANLCEMTGMGLPVPFGFVITTSTCREFFQAGNKLPSLLAPESLGTKKAVNSASKVRDHAQSHLVEVGDRVCTWTRHPLMRNIPSKSNRKRQSN